MEALYRRGVRYPISFAGAETDVAVQFPVAYKKLDEVMKKARGKGNPLLIGVTGGIACGKTTVSGMLEELGAPVIDFDLIARQVVEPGDIDEALNAAVLVHGHGDMDAAPLELAQEVVDVLDAHSAGVDQLEALARSL